MGSTRFDGVPDRTIANALAFALVSVVSACGADPIKPDPSFPLADGATPPSTTMDAGRSTDPIQTVPEAGKPPSTVDATGPVTSDAGSKDAGGADGATVADAGPITPSVEELPADFTNLDVTHDKTRRFGAPHIAVNPKNPNNVVVLASSDLGYTRACVPAAKGSDCEMINVGIPFLDQPRGFYKTAGFMDIGVHTSFDRGKTFKKIDISALVPPGHPEVRARGEGPIAVTADGTFYIGFNAINWGQWDMQPITFFPNGGVGVIKSTDGGSTWSWASYSFTPADWPYGCSDLVTGELYVTSGLAGISTIGSKSNGMAGSPEGKIADRWIASTKDGITWTAPQPLGGENGANHVGANHSSAAAAHGILATLFVTGDQNACTFFLGAGTRSPCVVFQTSTDAGKSWSRHRVPTPTGFATSALSLLVAADPSKKGHFTAALLSESGNDLWVYDTPDSGSTWGKPVEVTGDTTKQHFSPWVAFSPSGEYGVMWRMYEGGSGGIFGSGAPHLPYSVWAVFSKDGGTTFSRPLKVSKANSPSPPNDSNDAFRIVGDHGPSGMALDGKGGAYVVWADWTTGERGISLAVINTKAFMF